MLIFMALGMGVKAQGVGLSFSFFFPKNGEFSMPVSPFSYRGVALPFTDIVGIQTGASLYRMGGLNMTELPFESNKSLLGPNLTLYVPLELYFRFGSDQATLTFKGGVFGFAGMFNKLNEGNFDRAIREYENWEVANSDLAFEAKPGWGYQAGMEFLFYVNRQFGITAEINYLSGGANYPITGSYLGGNQGQLNTVTADYPDARVDLTGWEISLGAVFGN